MKRLFFLPLLLLAPPAHATELTLHGGIKNETAYFISGQKRLDKVQNRLELKPEVILNNHWEFRGRFLAWYDAAMDINTTNNSDLTPTIKNDYRTALQSKEAYLLYGGDTFDFRLGQQQIVWGKTDGLRMLDIINPLDMREFMLDDFLDSRIGVVAARLNYYADLKGSQHEFEFLLIPDAKPASLAPIGSRWGYALPTPPPNTTLLIQPAKKPGWRFSDTEAGMAWRANLNGWDLSLNAFHGWKDTPAMQKMFSPNLLTLTPIYQRMNTAGGSFSNAFGEIVLRGEVAVNSHEVINQTGVTASTSVGSYTTWNGAMGLDYNQTNWRISPQLFMRHISNWQPFTSEKRNSGFISLMVGTDYLNEKLKPDIIGLYDWAQKSWMARPKVSYEWSDQVTMRFGADLFSGSQGLFAQFTQNNRLYSETEYTF